MKSALKTWKPNYRADTTINRDPARNGIGLRGIAASTVGLAEYTS